MAIVDLSSAKSRLERIIADVKDNKLVPSIELMVSCVNDIQGAIIKTHRERLSDRRHDFCQIRDCGGNGRFHVCLEHAGEEIQQRVKEEEK